MQISKHQKYRIKNLYDNIIGSKYKKEFEDSFRTITQLGYALFFISHAKDKTFKREDGTEYNQVVPTLGNSYNEIIKDMAK